MRSEVSQSNRKHIAQLSLAEKEENLPRKYGVIVQHDIFFFIIEDGKLFTWRAAGQKVPARSNIVASGTIVIGRYGHEPFAVKLHHTDYGIGLPCLSACWHQMAAWEPHIICIDLREDIPYPVFERKR